MRIKNNLPARGPGRGARAPVLGRGARAPLPSRAARAPVPVRGERARGLSVLQLKK